MPRRKTVRKTTTKARSRFQIRSDPGPTADTPSSSSTTKIAPRSGLQFKIGPPFGLTNQIASLFITETNRKVTPILSSRIDRGFENIDDEWIGYKRNYFSIVSSFSFDEFDESSSSVFQKHGFSIETVGEVHRVERFVIRLVSKSMEDDVDVVLVQHTAKRDRGPIFEPPIIPVIPGTIPDHELIRDGANIKKVSRIREFERLFCQNRDSLPTLNKFSILRNYNDSDSYTKVVKYERIQFASSFNAKKQAVNEKKRFILQIQLLAKLKDDKTYAIIATSNTPPLLIRSRSPGSYNSTPSTSTPVLKDISNTCTNTPNKKSTIDEVTTTLPERTTPQNPFQSSSEYNSSTLLHKILEVAESDSDNEDELESDEPMYFLLKSKIVHETTDKYMMHTNTFSKSLLNNPMPRFKIHQDLERDDEDDKT
ncbi:hypothetical protein G210_0659, partial [Candida maltosa Xu316]